MNYRIEEKPEMILTGYKSYFTGAPYGKEREKQIITVIYWMNGNGRIYTTKL